MIRKATKQRKPFPTDDSAMKGVYLAIQAASKKWTMPIRNRKSALNRFITDFGDRLTNYQQATGTGSYTELFTESAGVSYFN